MLTVVRRAKRFENGMQFDLRCEREVRQMTDVIPQPIVVFAPDGGALYGNESMLEYIGLSRAEFWKGDARELHPDDVERVQDERRMRFADGVPFQLENRMRGKDGQYRWFLIYHMPLRDEQGDIVRWYATGTDIDDRKRAEATLRSENLALREEIDQVSMFEEIIGSSDAVRTVLRQAAKAAPTDSTVLILGETGTGKELLARAIHKRSNRATRAFIRVNCAAIPPALLAFELFGHEKGAFASGNVGHLQNQDPQRARSEGRFRLSRVLNPQPTVLPMRRRFLAIIPEAGRASESDRVMILINCEWCGTCTH